MLTVMRNSMEAKMSNKEVLMGSMKSPEAARPLTRELWIVTRSTADRSAHQRKFLVDFRDVNFLGRPSGFVFFGS